MKKNTKFLALLLTLLIMCLCLTGCDELDEMREQQAFWTEEGSYDSITYNKNEYKRIPGYGHPDPMYNQSINSTIYVTDKDVPVLLSESFSDYLNISDNKNFIYGYLQVTSTEKYDTYTPSEALYCKADIYDEIMSKIDEGVNYTKYGFGFYCWDEEEMIDHYEYYYLTDEEIDAVNKVIKTVEPVEGNFNYNYQYIVALDKVSDDKYFGKHTYELYTDGLHTYYLVSYSEALDINTFYEVPEELNDIFDNLKQTATGEGFRRIG